MDKTEHWHSFRSDQRHHIWWRLCPILAQSKAHDQRPEHLQTSATLLLVGMHHHSVGGTSSRPRYTGRGGDDWLAYLARIALEHDRWVDRFSQHDIQTDSQEPHWERVGDSNKLGWREKAQLSQQSSRETKVRRQSIWTAIDHAYHSVQV